jgi:hypothetical protein
MKCDNCKDTGLIRQEDETLALCPENRAQCVPQLLYRHKYNFQDHGVTYHHQETRTPS